MEDKYTFTTGQMYFNIMFSFLKSYFLGGRGKAQSKMQTYFLEDNI